MIELFWMSWYWIGLRNIWLLKWAQEIENICICLWLLKSDSVAFGTCNFTEIHPELVLIFGISFLSFQHLLFPFRTNFIFPWHFYYFVVDDTWDAEKKVWLHFTSQSTAVVHLWKASANSSCYLGARLHTFVSCIYKSVCLDIKLSGN